MSCLPPIGNEWVNTVLSPMASAVAVQAGPSADPVGLGGKLLPSPQLHRGGLHAVPCAVLHRHVVTPSTALLGNETENQEVTWPLTASDSAWRALGSLVLKKDFKKVNPI